MSPVIKRAGSRSGPNPVKAVRRKRISGLVSQVGALPTVLKEKPELSSQFRYVGLITTVHLRTSQVY